MSGLLAGALFRRALAASTALTGSPSWLEGVDRSRRGPGRWIAAGGSVLVLCGLGGMTGPAQAQATGSVYVDANGNAFVGYQADGSVTVSGGSSLNAATTILGLPAGATGTVTIDGQGSTATATGTVTIGAAGAGLLTVSDGGLAQVGGQGDGTIVLARDAGSSGSLNIGAAAGSPAVAAGAVRAGSVVFGAGTGALVFNHTGDPNGAAVTFAPAISGTGSVSNLSGVTTLTGANLYSGATTVSGGTLVAASGTALGAADGTAANGTTVAGGATLGLSGGVAIGNEALSLTGYGDNTAGALRSLSGDNRVAGAITTTGLTKISVDAGSTLALTGPISGTGTLLIGGMGDGTATGNITNIGILNKTDAGSWTLTGQNTVQYSFFDNGTSRLQDGGTLTDESGMIGFLGNGTVIVSGKGSAWINTVDVAVGLNGAGTLTVTNGGTVVAGTQGDGKIYLGARNDPTIAATGTLVIGAAFGSTPATAGTVKAGEVTTDGGTGTIVFNHTGNPDGSDVTFTPTIAGANSLVQAAGVTILPGANTYTGTTTVSGGTLAIQNANALGAADGTAATGTTLTGLGTLALQGGVALGNEALTLDGGTLRSVSGSNSYAGPISLTNSSAITVDSGSSLALSGAVTGSSSVKTLVLGGAGDGAATGGLALAGPLVKAGTGTWTLTGTNSANWTEVAGGTLAVRGGASVSGGYTAVGAGASTDAPATLAVSGAGTSWTTQGGGLFVGAANAGVLTVSDGASVSSNGSWIGRFGGVAGTATVTGAHSTWTDNLYVCVGCFGPGTLTVADGGLVTSPVGYVGVEQGSTGAVTVTGPNSAWTGNARLYVGYRGGNSGTGTVTVANGGTLTSGDTYAGFAPGSFGAVTVTGADSTWTNSGVLYLGIGGTGSLTVADGGRVTASDSVLGLGSLTASGSATVTGTGSVWANTASLTVGVDGTGSLTLADGGTVSVGPGGTGTVTLASDPTGTGTLTIGAAAGAAPAAPGTVQAAAVTTGQGTGTVVFNHSATDYIFAPAITGPTSVKQLAGTTILTNTSTFTGPTTVSGGTLQVDGTLTSTDVTVTSGGTLAGSGKIGDPLIQAGGTLAPGSAASIGTLSIYGPLTFEPGSFYRVRIGRSANDRVDVAGPVTLNGGTVQVAIGAGTVLPGQSYTIIAAPGGVTGTFTALQTNRSFAFLAPTLSYDATHVTLGIVQVAPFSSVATTRNQVTTALALGSVPFGDGTGPASPAAQVAIALVNQETVAGAQQALTALSGEVQGSAVSARVQTAFAEQTAILDHLRFGAGTGPAGGPTLAGSVGQRFAAGTTLPAAYAALPRYQAGEPGRVTLQPEAPRVDVWGSAFGSFGHADSTRTTARLTRDTGGFVLGAETGTGALVDAVGRARVGLGDWRLGMAAGYSFTQFDITGRASSGQIESGFGSLYARGPLGPLQVRLGGLYAGDAYDTRRSVVFPGVSQVASGRSGGNTLQGFGEVGYRIGGAQGYIEPFVGGAALRIRRDGFTETGGAAALASFGRNYDLQTVSTGVQGQMVLADLWGGAGPLLARGLVGVRFAFGDVTPAALLAFRGGGGAFPILGAPVATEAALVSAGLDWQVAPGTQIGLGYEGQIGTRTTDNAIKGNVSHRW